MRTELREVARWKQPHAHTSHHCNATLNLEPGTFEP